MKRAAETLQVAPEATTLRFSVSAGRVVAGQIEREIRRAAHENGLTIEVERHKGWIEVLLLVTVTGEGKVVTAYAQAVNRWLEENDGD